MRPELLGRSTERDLVGVDGWGINEGEVAGLRRSAELDLRDGEGILEAGARSMLALGPLAEDCLGGVRFTDRALAFLLLSYSCACARELCKAKHYTIGKLCNT